MQWVFLVTLVVCIFICWKSITNIVHNLIWILSVRMPFKLNFLLKWKKWSRSGGYPGFVERGFICIKVWGFALLILSHFFLNIPWKWNNLVSLRPNNFIFIGYLKTGVERGVRANPLNPSGSPTDLCIGRWHFQLRFWLAVNMFKNYTACHK